MKKRSKNQANDMPVWTVIPIVLFMAIVPLLMYAKVVRVPELNVPWVVDATEYVDIFAYYKSVAVILSAFLSAVMFHYVKKWEYIDGKRSYITYCMFGLMGLVVASFAIADYKTIALWGYKARFEGSLVWLSYIWMAYYTMRVVKTTEQWNWILGSLFASGTLLGMLGLLQFAGADPFRTEAGLRLIIPNSLEHAISSMKVNYHFEESRVYMTLYNPNFVGIFAAMMTLFYGNALLLVKKNWQRFGLLLLIVFMILALFGSYSRSGLIGLAAGLVLFILLHRKKILGNTVRFTIVIVTLLIVVLAGDMLSNHILSDRMKQVFQMEPTTNTGIRSIDMSEPDQMVFQIGERTLNVHMFQSNPSKGCIFTTDGQKAMKAIADDEDKSQFRLEDEQFSDLVFKYLKHNEDLVLSAKMDGAVWNFALTPEGFRFINDYGNYIVLEQPESIGFEGYEKIGSNRGYMWSRTLPLIKDAPLLGYGADTYAMHFPQTDYVGKHYAYGGRRNLVVDRPHNVYMQWSMNFGIFFGILMLGLTGASLLKKNKSIYNKGALLVFICFMIAGLFNDSSLHISTIVWGSLGLSLSDYEGEETVE